MLYNVDDGVDDVALMEFNGDEEITTASEDDTPTAIAFWATRVPEA